MLFNTLTIQTWFARFHEHTGCRTRFSTPAILLSCILLATCSLGLDTPQPGTGASASSGTVSGIIENRAGKPIPGAKIHLRNLINGYRQDVAAAADGSFTLFNIPPDTYRLAVETADFPLYQRDLEIHPGVPHRLRIKLDDAAETVEVSSKRNLLEGHASSHQDIDSSTLETGAAAVQSRALEAAVLTTPGFIKDENGRFHFRGSHGQAMYVIDGVPLTDAVNATFSNSLDPAQVQSMSVLTGGVSAQYGGKPVAVIEMTTKSGIGTPGGYTGDVSLGGASFSTRELGLSLRGGTSAFGYSLVAAGSSSDRFLDPINFENFHNHGTASRVYTRFDWAVNARNSMRFSFSGGQSDREVVNLASQQLNGRDWRIGTRDFNANMSWLHVFDDKESVEATFFYRHSTQRLTPTLELQPGFTTGGPDFPFWASQDRSLDNLGVDLAYNHRTQHNAFRAGFQYVTYPIHEKFGFAITDDTQVADPADPLYPYTPAGGGAIFRFDERIHPSLASVYVQDDIDWNNWNLALGVRADKYQYRSVDETRLEPRLGAAYTFAVSGTTLRASFDRLMITPANEGLAMSTSQQLWTATSGQTTPVAVIKPELQNSYLVGVEQQIGKVARISLDYWVKNSVNASDDSQFLDTGILFPIAAAKGHFHGLDLRFDTVVIHGWSGYLSVGTVRTIFFDPTVGGLDAASTSNDTLPYFIDHDQKLSLQAGLKFEHKGFTGQLTGRHDSGLVSGDPGDVAGNPDYDFGIPFVHLTQDRYVGPTFRIKPHDVVDLSLAQEIKLGDKRSLRFGVNVLNLFDEKALYNFLSTFGGTHVVPPRTFAGRIQFKF